MKKHFTVFFLVFLSLYLNAQQEMNIHAADGMKIRFIPSEYVKPHLVVKTYESQQSSGLPWMVYSDRPNNQTFTSSDGNNAFKTIDFLQSFFVVEEKGDFIHIYKEAEGAEGSFTLSKNAEDFGWVNKANMLLWRKCLYTELDVSVKAIFLKNLEPVRFYLDPQLEIQAPGPSAIATIYYVYKFHPSVAAPTSVLLGAIGYTTGGIVTNEICGWVDFKKIIILYQRLFALPNNNLVALEERKKDNVRATVFKDINSARDFAANKNVDEDLIAWNSDDFTPIFSGSYMRFPVLWNAQKIRENKGIMKLLVIDTNQRTGFIGYAPPGTSNRKNDLWQFNLFYTMDEFFDVKKTFEKLTESMSAPERRRLFSDAWRQILAKSIGNDSPDYKSITIGEVETLVFGLTGLSEFNTLTLSDLDNPEKFSNEKLGIWQSVIEKRLKGLDKIWNSAGEFSYNINGNRYFWLPQAYLP